MHVPDARPAPRGRDYWTRWLVAASLLAGAISVIVVLDYGGYPFEPYRYWIFEYLLRTQDLSGAALLMLMVLVAYFFRANPGVLGWVDAMSRHPWRVAAVAFVMLCLGTLYIEHNHPLAQDEYAALFQSRAFAAGRLTGQFPLDMLGRLIPSHYMNQFLYVSLRSGEVASAYWPGFALLLAPFSLVKAPWACNPLLASLALVLMGRIAMRLSGEPRAAGWAMLLALASPAFTAMALTYFSMTAHLLLNLVFVWLLLERTTGRLAMAGAVGSFALLLHNPVPHALFAAPWIVWLALQRDAPRNLLALAAGYVPLVLGVGFGWALLLSELQGPVPYALLPYDGNMLNSVANFFWDWHIKMRSALAGPGDLRVAVRAAELARLWNWAVPGLVLLAATGWWIARRDVRARLLGLSVLSTLAGYLFVDFDQGYGWGARYFHPAWGALPVMAALALVRAPLDGACDRLRSYVGSLAVLSLVLGTALRCAQIHGYLESHLANRPPAAAGARQVVFVALDRAQYTADLVQNDPFLRNEVWYLISFGAESNQRFMRARFPGARREFADRRGEIWRVE